MLNKNCSKRKSCKRGVDDICPYNTPIRFKARYLRRPDASPHSCSSCASPLPTWRSSSTRSVAMFACWKWQPSCGSVCRNKVSQTWRLMRGFWTGSHQPLCTVAMQALRRGQKEGVRREDHLLLCCKEATTPKLLWKRLWYKKAFTDAAVQAAQLRLVCPCRDGQPPMS